MNVKVTSKLGVVSRKLQTPSSRLDVQQVSSLDRQYFQPLGFWITVSNITASLVRWVRGLNTKLIRGNKFEPPYTKTHFECRPSFKYVAQKARSNRGMSGRCMSTAKYKFLSLQFSFYQRYILVIPFSPKLFFLLYIGLCLF